VRWFARCALWATVLALPCWLVSHGYQLELGRVAERVMAFFGEGIRIRSVDVMAPFDLGMFLAMCCASTKATWRRRARAMSLGTPVLIAIEVLTLVLGIVILIAGRAGPFAWLDEGTLSSSVLASIPWIGAILVWLPLLGPAELGPFLDAARHKPSAGARTGRR
jgi:hypothetical protein